MANSHHLYVYTNSNNNEKVYFQKLKTPWFAMARSGPLWALTLVHMALNWSFWTLLTLSPTYISGVLRFDIKKNGVLSAVPYFAMWVSSLVLSVIGDYLIKKNVFSIGISRKFWNSLALYGGAAALTLLSFVNTGPTEAIVLLTIAVGINSAAYLGYYLNHLDLAPNFVGAVVGITSTAANVCSIFAPTVAGFIVTQEDNAAQWRIVFLITAAFLVIGETVFNIYGSAEVQSWNADCSTEMERKENTRKESAP